MKNIQLIRVMVGTLFITGLSTSGFAFEPRFSVSRDVNLEDMVKTPGTIEPAQSVTYNRNTNTYILDMSMVVPKGNLPTLLKVALAYDQYTKMKMPHLDKSEITLKVPKENRMVIFTQLSYWNLVDAHYLDVYISRNIGPNKDSAGIRWQIHPDPSERLLFTRFDGSWYLQPLPSGDVYIRYYLESVPESEKMSQLPAFLVKPELKRGAEQVIHIIVDVADRQYNFPDSLNPPLPSE